MPDDYENDLRHTRLFLKGESEVLMRELADQMDSAAEALEFERAAELRDQITALRSVQSRQVIEEGSGDLDIVAAILEAGLICVHILFIRQEIGRASCREGV